MILYDKDTKFIGVSADVLSVLGYEDIDTFMSYNNDVADLFINRAGYIHKFENFSWISYVVNGSMPNKNVILKARNGGEIEASLLISEILLPNRNEDKYFVVQLGNIRKLSENAPTSQTGASGDFADRQPIFKLKESEEPSAITDFVSPINISQTPSQPIAQSFPPTQDSNNDNKITFAFDKEDMTSSPSIVSKTKADVAETPKIKIDLGEVSDILGISSDDVVAYMKDYTSYLDENLLQLQRLYQEGNTGEAKKIVVNLIGIGSNLRAKEMVQSLQKLLAVGAGLNSETTLREIKSVAAAFKQSVESL